MLYFVSRHKVHDDGYDIVIVAWNMFPHAVLLKNAHDFFLYIPLLHIYNIVNDTQCTRRKLTSNEIVLPYVGKESSYQSLIGHAL